jgi:hypothetical protein
MGLGGFETIMVSYDLARGESVARQAETTRLRRIDTYRAVPAPAGYGQYSSIRECLFRTSPHTRASRAGQ